MLGNRTEGNRRSYNQMDDTDMCHKLTVSQDSDNL